MAKQFLDLAGLTTYNTKLNGKFVDLTSAQTVSGVKTFSNYIKTPQVANSNGNALVREKSTEGKSVFGNDSSAAVLMGNTDRPYYSKSGSDFNGVELALKSDITGGGSTALYLHKLTISLGYTRIFDSSGAYVNSGQGYAWVELYSTSSSAITSLQQVFSVAGNQDGAILGRITVYYMVTLYGYARLTYNSSSGVINFIGEAVTTDSSSSSMTKYMLLDSNAASSITKDTVVQV